MTTPLITVHQIAKKFRIEFIRNPTALARFVTMLNGGVPSKTIWALKDISLEVNPGEIVGLIGKNGSGKSTLLRIIAGIYHPTQGSVETNGKIISLINLKTGLYPRLTVRNNIYFLCALLGLSNRTITQRLSLIIEFAGLEEMIDAKVYQLSEGMRERLAIAAAIHSDPQILLLDEVFEIGDITFRKKSAEAIKQLASKGTSILVAGHDMDLISLYCGRTLWLENGFLKAKGPSVEIVAQYQKNGL